MGTGYVRQDVSNEIDNGNVIDASSFDAEYDAIEEAFSSTIGHTHDGTAAEGAPIEVIGPAQEYVSTATEFAPKENNTYDLGSATNGWRDLYVERDFSLEGDASITGTVSLGGTLDVTGNTTLTDLNVTSNVVVGGTLRGADQLVVKDEVGNGVTDVLFQTSDGQTRNWLRNDGNQYLRVLSFNGSSTVQNARIDAPGTFVPSEKSVITREKGDARYVERADTALPASILSAIIDHVYPVGTVLWTSNSTNPGVYWPGTTWVAEFVGRAAHGAGGGRANGQGWGGNTRSISVQNLPSHKHGPGTYNGVTDVEPDHTHGATAYRDFITGGGSLSATGLIQETVSGTTGAGEHSHTVSITGGESGATGSGTPFDVNQPSQARHAWRRTG